MAQNYGLGRGLSSLIPNKKTDESSNTSSDSAINLSNQGKDATVKNESPFMQNEASFSRSGVQNIDVIKIFPNPHQPRLKFDEAKMAELASSIKEHGIIQPLVVSKNGNEYELIAGERRLQAAKIVGLKQVPAIIREATDQQKLELAVIENIQRHDLNPVEEAKSYVKLAEDFDLNQEEIAQKVGKSRSAIANKMRLLHLPVEIQKSIIEGKITEGHAKAILAIENPEKQRALFEMIIRNNLTVRQAEEKTKEVSVRTHIRKISSDPELKALEDKLTGALGTKVKISKSGGGGRITIEYYSKEELDNILQKISK